jgi:hypothetical protein
MLKRFLTAVSILLLPIAVHAEPVCLGETSEWEDHHWVYTTLEGVEWDVCSHCDGEWEAVPEWVAGFEALCPQEGWEEVPMSVQPFFSLFIEVIAGTDVHLMRPAYDWDDCQHLVLRCPKTSGC